MKEEGFYSDEKATSSDGHPGWLPSLCMAQDEHWHV